MSDQDKISPYNINTKSSRQVRTIRKKLNQGTTIALIGVEHAKSAVSG